VAAQAPLCFEMSAATGGEVGTMAEVVAAARRVRASFLNTYAVDVLRATPGTATTIRRGRPRWRRRPPPSAP
jgi:hypothetical protein